MKAKLTKLPPSEHVYWKVEPGSQAYGAIRLLEYELKVYLRLLNRLIRRHGATPKRGLLRDDGQLLGLHFEKDPGPEWRSLRREWGEPEYYIPRSRKLHDEIRRLVRPGGCQLGHAMFGKVFLVQVSVRPARRSQEPPRQLLVQDPGAAQRGRAGCLGGPVAPRGREQWRQAYPAVGHGGQVGQVRGFRGWRDECHCVGGVAGLHARSAIVDLRDGLPGSG